MPTAKRCIWPLWNPVSPCSVNSTYWARQNAGYPLFPMPKTPGPIPCLEQLGPHHGEYPRPAPKPRLCRFQQTGPAHIAACPERTLPPEGAPNVLRVQGRRRAGGIRLSGISHAPTAVPRNGMVRPRCVSRLLRRRWPTFATPGGVTSTVYAARRKPGAEDCSLCGAWSNVRNLFGSTIHDPRL